MSIAAILERFPPPEILPVDLATSIETELKFAGYLCRQDEEIRKLRSAEGEVIPEEFCYDSIPGLRTEAREKFKRFRPYSIGQAMRIPGITPTAVSLLAIHLKRFKEAA